MADRSRTDKLQLFDPTILEIHMIYINPINPINLINPINPMNPINPIDPINGQWEAMIVSKET